MPTPIGHALGGAIIALALMPEVAGSPVRRFAAAGSRGFAALQGRGRSASLGNSTVDMKGRRTAASLQPRSGEPANLRTFLPWCALAACLPDLDFFWGRHNMETHSLGFAALVGLAVFVWRRDRRLAVACFLAVCTHVLFDWLGSDDFPPLGVMALWPITSQFYFANAFIFDAISRRYWLPGFVQHNVIAVLRELAILVPIVAGMWLWRHATDHRSTDGDSVA